MVWKFFGLLAKYLFSKSFLKISNYLIKDFCMVGKEPNEIPNKYTHNKNQTENKKNSSIWTLEDMSHDVRFSLFKPKLKIFQRPKDHDICIFSKFEENLNQLGRPFLSPHTHKKNWRNRDMMASYTISRHSLNKFNSIYPQILLYISTKALGSFTFKWSLASRRSVQILKKEIFTGHSILLKPY